MAQKQQSKNNSNVPRQVGEAFDLLNSFYGFVKEGDPDQYVMKDSFREDAYRLIVLQFHLTIEELLKGFIYDTIRHSTSRKTFTAKQNIDYVQRLNSHTAIDLAARLGILSRIGHDELTKLNALRNRCSHNWTLHAYTMIKQAKNGPRKRRYKVEFNGKNLLNLEVMKKEFIPLYSDVYLELFAVYYGIRHRHLYLEKGIKGPPEKAF